MDKGSNCIEDENCQSIQDDKGTTENIGEQTVIQNLQNEDVRKPERTADSLEEEYANSNNTNSLEVDKEEAKYDNENDKFSKNENRESEETLEIGNEFLDSSEGISTTSSVENLLTQNHSDVGTTKTNDEKYIINGEPNEIVNDPDDNILSGGDETDGHIDEVIEGPVLLHITSKRVKAPKRNKPSQRFLKDNKNITETLIEVDDEPNNLDEVSIYF